jgi:hypothetical protein
MPKKSDPPEILAARAQLDRLPGEWVSPELRDQVIARAEARAVANRIDERLQAARAEVAAALAAGNVDAAIVAEARCTALASLRGQVPGLSIGSQLTRRALNDAGSQLTAAVRQLDVLELSYEVEVRQWRGYCQSSGRLLDPPAGTDRDRAAIPARAEAVNLRDGIVASQQTWTRDVTSAADPLMLLASAKGQLDAAEQAAPKIADANRQINEANAARRGAALVWNYERAQDAQMAGVK